MADELVIDDSNFDQYFFDCRKHKPQPGQIMACFSAVGEFGSSAEKMHLINLLLNTDKANAAVQVMRKLHHASKIDSIKVPRQMVEDLMAGQTAEQVNDKIYRFTIQMYFYTKPEYMPKGNPHWSTISLLNTKGTITIGPKTPNESGDLI